MVTASGITTSNSELQPAASLMQTVWVPPERPPVKSKSVCPDALCTDHLRPELHYMALALQQR
jgi:hypothetical protein